MTRRQSPPALALSLPSLPLLLLLLLVSPPPAPQPRAGAGAPSDAEGGRSGLGVAGAAAVGLTRACGTQLADLLAVVCRGRGYNDPQATASAAGVASASAGGVGGGGMTRSTGVADTCCRSYCSVRDLLQYCSPTDPRRSSGPESSVAAVPGGVVPAASVAALDASAYSPPVRALLEKRPGGRKRSGKGAASSSPAPAYSPASFRVGVVRSYFNDFVVPPGAAAAVVASPAVTDWPSPPLPPPPPHPPTPPLQPATTATPTAAPAASTAAPAGST